MSTDDDLSIGRILNTRGWSQGRVAGAQAQAIVADALVRHGRESLATALWEGKACAVMLSQTCDIVCEADGAEPYVEFLIAQLCDGAPNPADTFLKSFRRFAATCGNGSRHLLFRPWDRCLVERAQLTGAGPSDDLVLARRSVTDLVDWLTTRYVRAALPDTFVERVKHSGAEEKLRKALTGALEVTEVFLLLKPRNTELTKLDELYECDVVLLCQMASFLDSKIREKLEPILLEFEEVLSGVPGVGLEGVRLRGEHEFSRHEMRLYDRWQFDDVSYAAEYRSEKKAKGGPLPAYRADLGRSQA